MSLIIALVNPKSLLQIFPTALFSQSIVVLYAAPAATIRKIMSAFLLLRPPLLYYWAIIHQAPASSSFHPNYQPRLFSTAREYSGRTGKRAKKERRDQRGEEEEGEGLEGRKNLLLTLCSADLPNLTIVSAVSAVVGSEIIAADTHVEELRLADGRRDPLGRVTVT